MLSTFISEAYDQVALVMLVGVVGFVGVGWWLRRRGRAGHRVLGVLTLLSLLGALLLAVIPDPTSRAAQFCALQLSIATGGTDLPNLVLLLPTAFFGALRVRRFVPVAAAVLGVSALIELVQALASGLGRSCDTDDFVFNAVGAIVGVLLAAAVVGLDRWNTRRATSAPAPAPAPAPEPRDAAEERADASVR